MKVKFSDQQGNDVTFVLNESEAAHAFERMLPMTVELTNFASNEKGFYPRKKINTFGAPLAPGGLEGLCYHKPWNQVIIFYGGYSDYEDLYELGYPISGQGQIRNLKGPVLIEEIY